MVRLGLWICEKVKYHFHHIISKYMLLTWLIINDVYLDHLLKIISVRFVHCEVIIFAPFHTVLFRRKSPHAIHLYRVRSYVSLHCKMGGGGVSTLFFFCKADYLFSPLIYSISYFYYYRLAQCLFSFSVLYSNTVIYYASQIISDLTYKFLKFKSYLFTIYVCLNHIVAREENLYATNF